MSIASAHRVAAIAERRFTHDQFWAAVAPSIASPRLQVREVGRSMQNRPLQTVTFGTGPTSVLLWSQMHGDEATATMALADIFHWLAADVPSPLRERLSRELTITFLPLLNPDGAQLFQRENAAGIDINRDARRLASPEARALKGVHDALAPDFGFNLHDQGARTRVGRSGEQAAIALLAPAHDASRGYNDVRARARQVAAVIVGSLQPALAGRIAKYDDTFNPRAFGDLVQQWGTSTVLIESGALPGDPEKQQLRAHNVVAIVAALDAIATGAYGAADPALYEDLPFNAGGTYDVLVVGGTLVVNGSAPLRADVAINYDEAVRRTGGTIREVGDLSAAEAIDTIDVTGMFLHPRPDALTRRDGHAYLRVGAPALFDVRRGSDAASERIREIAR